MSGRKPCGVRVARSPRPFVSTVRVSATSAGFVLNQFCLPAQVSYSEPNRVWPWVSVFPVSMTGPDTPKHSMNLRERRRLLELHVDTLACFQMLLLATTSSARSTPQARERWKVKHTAGVVVHTTATPLLVTQHNIVLGAPMNNVAHCGAQVLSWLRGSYLPSCSAQLTPHLRLLNM